MTGGNVLASHDGDGDDDGDDGDHANRGGVVDACQCPPEDGHNYCDDDFLDYRNDDDHHNDDSEADDDFMMKKMQMVMSFMMIKLI